MRFKAPSRVLKALIVVGACLVAIAALVVLLSLTSFQARHRRERVSAGVSFSVPYARDELKTDWRANFTALLDDLKVRQFRLMSYWDEVEPAPGQFIFTDLDWQMDQAASRGAKASLAIGLRQPRWPECHYPGWVLKLPADQRQAPLNSYMTKVVERYKTHPALASYQLENEALNKSFAPPCAGTYNRQRLLDEYALVKALDSIHPVIVNASNQYGFPVRGPKPDIFGFSVYHRVYDHMYTKKYFDYWVPAWWFRLRAAVIEWYWHTPVIIHELQTEPWAPDQKSIGQTTVAEQDFALDINHLRGMIGYGKATGIKQMDLWGSEWWYWRKVHFNDPSIWEAARPAFR